MTMTEPDVTQATAIPHPDTISPRPTRNEMIAAVVAETGCSRKRARRMVNFLRSSTNTGRRYGYCETHLEEHEIDDFHAIMDLVMPDDAIATLGSAHDTLNRGICDPARGELGIVHTKGGPEAQYCVTYVQVNHQA